MDDLKRALAACMEEYDREIRQAVSQLRPGDGFMGLGRDPRREPCHLRFYESAGALVDQAVPGRVWPRKRRRRPPAFC